MQHKKFIGIFTAFVTAACCAVPTAFAVEEFEIVPSSATEISSLSIFDEYRDWSQMDPRWSDTPMGGTTIRRSGCLLTSLAIFSVHSGSIDNTALANMGISDIEQFNPGVLANAYTNANGFSYDGAIMSWGTISTIIPNVTFGADKYFQNTEKTAVAAELRALMAEGWHIIARVNNGSYHWAYIESVGDDDSITMCDPAVDTHDLYEAYPNGLQGEYWMLKGTNPPSASTGSAGETEASFSMEIGTMPDRTMFQYGESLDLSGGTVVLSGFDSEKGKWTETVDMADSDIITVDSSAYNSEVPGEYEIFVNADNGSEQASVSFTVSVCRSIGEHYVNSDDPVNVYSEQGTGSVQYTLKNGNVIHIAACVGNYGLIASTDIKGWVDMNQLEKTADHLHDKGDINDDGQIDKYDMSLLNTYLQQKEELPNGVSSLTAVQLYSADLNGDGVVDLKDVREYLMIV